MSHISPIELVSKEALVKIKSLAFNSETTDLDYKEIFKISDAKSKTEFIKDICAFANTKGGYLLYGINNDNEWIGLDERSDAKVDDADIANIIDDFVDGHIDCLVNTIEIDNRYFVVVYVFPSSSILPLKKMDSIIRKIGRLEKQNLFAPSRKEMFIAGDIVDQ